MSNLISPTLRNVERHPQYYIYGGDLYLLVGSTLFCVHSHFFSRDSPSFSNWLKETVEPGKPAKGSSDGSAYCIDSDITADEFAKFLWIWYNDKFNIYDATVSEWTSILKIACKLDFPKIKDFAIGYLEISDASIAERIQIYQEYNADTEQYLIPLLAKMSVRDEGPSDDETMLMGWPTTVTIFRARERLRTPTNIASSGGKSLVSDLITEMEAVKTISTLLTGTSNGSPDKSAPVNDKKKTSMATEKPLVNGSGQSNIGSNKNSHDDKKKTNKPPKIST